MSRVLICALVLLTFCSGGISAAGKKWLSYERCELKKPSGRSAGGDRVKARALTGYVYTFRLYGIDCPEKSSRSRRARKQMKEFKMGEKELLKWAERAEVFTREFLRTPFQVYTRKKKAGGGSSYYAIILNSEGKRLGEALLEAGLARKDDTAAEWDEPMPGQAGKKLPSRISKKRFLSKLRAIESKAKRERKGVWSKR